MKAKQNTPNYDNIRAAIDKIGNKLFSVKFIKRSTGELREMVARRKVTKHLKGGQLNYNPKEHNLLTVFEFKTVGSEKPAGYKCIPVENIKEIKLNGETFKF